MKRILALLVLALATSLFAEPRQWTEDGIPVAIDHSLDTAATVSNDAGYCLTVWAGSLGGPSVVIGQLSAPTGENLWESRGRLLAQGDLRAGYPIVIAVDGGWIVGWLDAEYINWCDGPVTDGSPCLEAAVRVIKIDNNGAPLWNSGRAGIEIVPSQYWSDYTPFELHPSGGGVIVTWGVTWEDEPLRARGVNATGIPWANSVDASSSLYGTRVQTISDLHGGLLIAWSRFFYRDSVIHANRMLPDGTLAWADAAGREILNAHDTLETTHLICPDGLGGMYVAWGTNNSADQQWVSRFDGNGNSLWETPARPCLYTTSRGIEQLVTSFSPGGPDGVLVNLGSSDNLVQKLGLDGDNVWPNNAVATCDDDDIGGLGAFSVTSDGEGGALTRGTDNIFDDNWQYLYSEIRTSRFSSNGAPAWNNNCQISGISHEESPQNFRTMILGQRVRHVWFEHGENHQIKLLDLNFATGQPLATEPTLVLDTDARIVREIRSAKLADGSTVIAWKDYAGDGDEVRYQILNVFGEPLLDIGGELLLTTSSNFDRHNVADFSVCEDDAGGFFAFVSMYDDTTALLRGARLNSSGNYLTDPAGVEIMRTNRQTHYTNLRCISDQASGAYVAIRTRSSLYTWARVSLMRVGTNCTPSWSNPFVVESDSAEAYPVALAPGLNRSCLLTTTIDRQYPGYFLQCTRVLEGGFEDWSVVLTDSAAYALIESRACSDGSGGAYVCWSKRTGTSAALYAQLLTADGELPWGEAGVMLSSPESYTENPACVADQNGTLTVVWAEGLSNETDIFAQRVSPFGERFWPIGGLTLCDAPSSQVFPTVTVLSDNEVYFTWEDLRSTPYGSYDYSLYGTHRNARGEIAGDSWWEENGNALLRPGFDQRSVSATADGAGGVVLAWLDQRTGHGYWHNSLFAQRLYDPIFTDAEETPVLPTEFSLAQNYPNPFNPTTVIEFALPVASHTSLKIFDVTGRLVATLVDGPQTAGTHHVSFDGSKLASGLYFYKLEAADKSFTRKMALIK
jgi:hypothetical protein